MLTMIPTREDVVAACFRGRIEKDDLVRYVDRVEAALKGPEPVHLYVELLEFGGVAWREIDPLVGNWLRMLGKVKRFGRIAIVSDTPWIRWASKLESALLPYVQYEIFRPEDREAALGWVAGELDRPRGSGVKLILTTSPDVLGFEVDGSIAADEIHALATYVNERLSEHRPVRLLGRIRRLDRMDISCLLDTGYIAMKWGMLKHLERYAIVGGPPWLAHLVNALDPVFKVIRHFDLKDEALAWAWLGAEPRELQSLVA